MYKQYFAVVAGRESSSLYTVQCFSSGGPVVFYKVNLKGCEDKNKVLLHKFVLIFQTFL